MPQYDSGDDALVMHVLDHEEELAGRVAATAEGRSPYNGLALKLALAHLTGEKEKPQAEDWPVPQHMHMPTNYNAT